MPKVQIGDRFGRLVVIADAGKKAQQGYVLCLCECGNEKRIRRTSLTKTKEPTRSCGCIQHEKALEIGAKTVRSNMSKRIRTDMEYNTNFGVIEKRTPPRNNTSGHKGVSWSVERQKYEVYISVHGRKILLGRTADYDEAVQIREEAEKEYHKPLIEQKNRERIE